MTTIHIADNYKMFVEGLSVIINDSGIAIVTGISHTLTECRQMLALNVPDILLLDIGLPDGSGIDFCNEVHSKYPGTKILVLTSLDEYSTVKRAIDCGASGYILKNALSEEVIVGIKTIAEGEIFLCKEIDLLMSKGKEQLICLTTREQELLKLIVDGYTNKEIADKIFLSIETIKTYRKNLIHKLGAKNSMMLVKMAIERKLV